MTPVSSYRRLTFMMLDADVAAVSRSSVYRVLSDAGLMKRHDAKASLKGTGFQQPLSPHEHWHVDVAYINVRGKFFFLCSVLDGCSRSIVHWEIRPKMEESDVETIVQRARERHPGVTPRIIISDNGPQFIGRDFKEFIRICGMTHVRTSPYYPQSNGKIKCWHRSIKSECIRPGTPLSVEDAVGLIDGYVRHYNEVRLHSAIGYVTPADKIGAERGPRDQDRRGRREAAPHSTSGLVLKRKIVPRRFVSQPLANARNRKLRFTLNHYNLDSTKVGGKSIREKAAELAKARSLDEKLLKDFLAPGSIALGALSGNSIATGAKSLAEGLVPAAGSYVFSAITSKVLGGSFLESTS
jgi:putative transposase